MKSTCPFCSESLSKFDDSVSNSAYYECKLCNSEYAELQRGDSTNVSQFKTKTYMVYSASNEDNCESRILDLSTNEVTAVFKSKIPIKDLTLDQVDDKIKKLIIFK